jgi:tetratricopeptide (TPR) repeat protein
MAKLTGQQLIQKAGKFHSAGKFGQAEKIYKQLLRANPNDLTLLRMLGMLERDRRNLKGALHWFTLAREVSGSDPIILAELALTLEQSGKGEKAWEIANEAQSIAPSDISIAIFYAKMCLSRGLASKAVWALEQAIDSEPNNAEAWHLLSMAANNSGTLPVPLHFAQKLIQLQPQEAQPHATLATAHRLNGNLNKALSSYEASLAKNPSFSEAIAGKAEVLESLGRTEEAQTLLNKAPPSDSVLIALAKVRIARKLHQPEVALAALDDATTPALSQYHKSNLLMHKGRVLEELQRYEEAWEAWEEGNKLHAGKFPLAEHCKLIDNIIQTPLLESGLSSSSQPIFIVGMFRSGTTLLEQILGAHPNIDAAGEVNQILRFVNESPYPTCISDPNTKWPQLYLDRLDSDSKYCTDKLPMNYLHIGLIHTLFPNAKIIHTTRNSLDTCVSCYSNSFSANHAYTSNLEDLAGVYEQYQKIMQHWNDKLPNRIYEVPYEKLVRNLEETINGVLRHIGVEFDPACLEFYNFRRIAITPSADQVRRPIYSSSVGRHKHFESHLDELTSLQ